MSSTSKAIPPFTGSAPGANTNTTTLYDSTAASKRQQSSYTFEFYHLRLKNSAGGTIKAYYSTDNGATWTQFAELVCLPSTSTTNTIFRARIGMYKAVKVDWVNGGSAQSTWSVQQECTDADSAVPVHGETSARLKGPLAAAGGSASATAGGFAVTIGTTHAVYTVPDIWKGRRVDVSVLANASAPTAKIWFAFGTSSSMEVDRTAVVSGTPPAWTGDAKIGRVIRDGETRDYYVDPSWTHFAAESDENTNKATLTIFPSDYAQLEA